MKPRIRKDLFRPGVFLCRSKENRRGLTGWITCSGNTPEEAYDRWFERVSEFRRESVIAEQRFKNLMLHDQWVPDAELVGVSRPVAFFRRLLHTVKGGQP